MSHNQLDQLPKLQSRHDMLMSHNASNMSLRSAFKPLVSKELECNKDTPYKYKTADELQSISHDSDLSGSLRQYKEIKGTDQPVNMTYLTTINFEGLYSLKLNDYVPCAESGNTLYVARNLTLSTGYAMQLMYG